MPYGMDISMMINFKSLMRLTRTTGKNVEKGKLDDHYLCTDIDRMEKIALQVPLSETKRPGWDEGTGILAALDSCE